MAQVLPPFMRSIMLWFSFLAVSQLSDIPTNWPGSDSQTFGQVYLMQPLGASYPMIGTIEVTAAASSSCCLCRYQPSVASRASSGRSRAADSSWTSTPLFRWRRGVPSSLSHSQTSCQKLLHCHLYSRPSGKRRVAWPFNPGLTLANSVCASSARIVIAWRRPVRSNVQRPAADSARIPDENAPLEERRASSSSPARSSYSRRRRWGWTHRNSWPIHSLIDFMNVVPSLLFCPALSAVALTIFADP